MKTTGLLSLVIVLACWSAAWSTNLNPSQNGYDPISVVEADYRAGSIDIDQKAVLEITAIKRPDDLPARYQVLEPSTGRSYLRSATPALVNIIRDWKLLRPATQQAINNLMARRSTAFTYDTPSGYFKLHWDTSGTNAVPTADLNGNGMPDFIEKCAAYVDTTYYKHIAMGFVMPPSDGGLGGDNKFDVYFEETPYYGYAQPEYPGPAAWDDYTSYLVLNRDFVGFPSNMDPEGNQAGAAKVTAAHEFHHCVQFGYNVYADTWYMEYDATCAEDLIFDQVNDNYNYLSDFFSYPSTSLMKDSDHYYSCFIWGLYLAQRFDTVLLRQAWEGGRYKSPFYALQDSLQSRFGWTTDSAFAEFAAWNYCTASENDGLHHAEASYYPAVQLQRTHTTYPVSTQTSTASVEGYAATYIRFVPNGTAGKLRIIVDGNDGREWAAYTIKTTGTNTHEFQKMNLEASGYCDTIDVYQFESCTSVTLVVCNTSEFSSGATFTYSASIKPGYHVTSQVPADSSLYAGATRNLRVWAKNLSSAGDGISVVYHDARGWAVHDSVTQYVAPNDTMVVLVPVVVPVGTPVGIQSPIDISVLSINDASARQDYTIQGTVVLQYGDINNSGVVDLVDLSTLVAYLTGGAWSPSNNAQAANFNCAGIVDLTDLSLLVNHLTGGGAHSPCNPF